MGFSNPALLVNPLADNIPHLRFVQNRYHTASHTHIPTSLLSSHTTEAHTAANPIVVSAEAEALSHSETTLKLTPSYSLFQILPQSEGGVLSASAAAYEKKGVEEGMDSLKGFVLSEAEERFMKKLPEPFKLVEGELQPFSDSIKELVSSDQPVLSMAAKHFFEKRHGKRFR